MSIVYITMECIQVIPDLYIIYVILILFLYFKDLKIKAMELKEEKWTLWHSLVSNFVLFTMGVYITRILFDDLIMPLAIELNHYTDEAKMLVSRRIQVLLGVASDFLTGTLLIYMFYANAKR